MAAEFELYKSIVLSQRDDFVCSDILREPTHQKTTCASFEQPSIVLQRTGNAGQVDQGGHGCMQSSSTFGPHNLGLNTAWMRAHDCSKWRQLVETKLRQSRLPIPLQPYTTTLQLNTDFYTTTAMLTDGRATR